ncbi:glycoside hydrolase family 2 protein [Thermus sediminis]|uniref:glycoside hydrolase family 2 protein n=1 Tax=Thermus sediminis TaxID=1761908 RepID=UPI000E3BCCAE|nr:sugar-binding domain-containing protein [Thermus sediminis]
MIPRPEHPRPDLERPAWQTLNGIWEFAFDPENIGMEGGWFTSPPTFPLRIRVPFPWESRLSGLGRTGYRGVAWYRRPLALPEAWRGRRLWLCFGAVDWHATVWLNGEKVGEHAGGYSEFRLDVSQQASFSMPNQLTVRVADFTDPVLPTGKQVGWYTPTSGIWQTVWLEATGPVAIRGFRILPLAGRDHLPTGRVRFAIRLDRGEEGSGEVWVQVRSPEGRFPTAEARAAPDQEEMELEIRVPEPILWSLEAPHLYPAEILLRAGRGAKSRVYDRVRTYFGIRTIAFGGYAGEYSFVLLNGKPIYLRGVLDQSFNPEGLYTAPSEAFLRRDLELAKAAGFNMLRIHVKADEPRRLYWADRLGLLVQQDLPNTWLLTHPGAPYTPENAQRARKAFAQTLRALVERDFNHPSLFCWTVFNEEWGLGSPEKAPEEHRIGWALEMVSLARRLDPTRLVHDNSGWSHLDTDLNSFHWYGRDAEVPRQLCRQASAEHLRPGEEWNYLPGYRQRGEPFVNNEFGYVSAEDGDEDISWGVLSYANALRSCEGLVGYTYTQLTDVEWEHNGVYNYDRSPKRFGYEFWAPGMTVRDVFAEDFLVLDVPAIKQARPGERVDVPVLFSHMSGRHEEGLTLRWQMRWLDRFGNWRESRVESRECPRFPPYRLTPLGTIPLTLPQEPALATLVAWVEGAEAGRVHTNYTQWWVRETGGLPRVEVVDASTLALRFAPEDFWESRFSEASAPPTPLEGKHYGRGHGFVEYRLRLPEGVTLEGAESLTFLCEVAAKAGREKVDWPGRPHPQDYPQSGGKAFPTTVEVSVNGVHVATWELPDDPADACGVLSHWRGREGGSYGYLRQAQIRMDSPEGLAIRNRLAEQGHLVLRLEVPWNAVHRGGLAIYGEGMGCYPVEPTVLLRYAEPLPLPVGWTSHTPVGLRREGLESP